MAFLDSIFKSSQRTACSDVSEFLGRGSIHGGFWGEDVFVYQYGGWEIILDTYTTTAMTNANSATNSIAKATRKSTRRKSYTRMRATFINKDSFQFMLSRKAMLSAVENTHGMQDTKTNDSFFDGQFKRPDLFKESVSMGCKWDERCTVAI